MKRNLPPSARRVRGFTLIELIAAFLVFAIAIGLLMQVLSSAMRQVRQSADYTMAALWAQSKLDSVGVGERVEAGRSNGRFDDVYSWDLNIQQVDPSAVERALEELRDCSPDWILSRAVKAGIDIGGPWWGDGPEQMAFALRSAPDLASLADAIVDHLGAVLTEPINIEMQECWQTKRSWAVEEGGGPLGSVRRPARRGSRRRSTGCGP